MMIGSHAILHPSSKSEATFGRNSFFFFFLNGKFGSLTDHWSIIVPPEKPPDHIHRPLEYQRATRGTTRSYPSPLGIMSHQFRRKLNKHGKTPLVGIEPMTYWSQSFIPPPRCH
ncbi:hypothetical protein Hanom_Chr07g00633291 [Helianthus anomalus]